MATTAAATTTTTSSSSFGLTGNSNRALCLLAALCAVVLLGAWESSQRMLQFIPTGMLVGSDTAVHTTNDTDRGDEQRRRQRDMIREARNVTFLDHRDLRKLTDAYAASWWMSAERFRRYDRDVVINMEGVVFHAIQNKRPMMNRMTDIRQTRDWMEWSVEHLSQYWKATKVLEFEAPYQRLMQNLYAFAVRESRPEARLLHTSSSSTNTTADDHVDNPMRETLAVLPWAPKRGSEKAQTFDIVVLATQIASLLRCDCARIDVAFHAPNWNYTITHIWPAVLDLLQHDETKDASLEWKRWWLDFQRRANTNIGSTPRLHNKFVVGNTEIVLVPLETSKPRNMPIPTAFQLYSALFVDAANETARTLRTAFLGPEPKRWKYIYYSEPDNPLQTRGYALPQFRRPLDRGLVLVPHRMHPTPHESDLVLPGAKHKKMPLQYYLPAIDNWAHVETLTDSCCDGGRAYYPARDDFPGMPGIWWTSFGGKAPTRDVDENDALRFKFRRMANYTLIRLAHGTNLAMTAAQQEGRRCIPTQGPCTPGR